MIPPGSLGNPLSVQTACWAVGGGSGEGAAQGRHQDHAGGLSVHSFATLLGDLSTIALNRVSLPTQEQTAITIATEPTQLQRWAFDLLGVEPQQTVSITVTG